MPSETVYIPQLPFLPFLNAMRMNFKSFPSGNTVFVGLLAKFSISLVIFK